jgi:hypothetical protein
MLEITIKKKLAMLETVRPILENYGLEGVIKISPSHMVTLVIHDNSFGFGKYFNPKRDDGTPAFRKPVHRVESKAITSHWSGNAQKVLLELDFALRFSNVFREAVWESNQYVRIEILSGSS